MKKFYTLLALLAVCFSASAADKLTFYIDGKPIENGSTVEFSDFKVTEDYGDGFCSLVVEPDLTLTTDFYSGKINVTAKCTTEGSTIQMCCGGTCSAGASVTKVVSLNPGMSLPLQFEYMNYEAPIDAFPTIVTEFTAVDEAGRNESAQFTLVMTPESAGVDAPAAVDGVSLTSAGLRYSLSAPAELSVYSIVGRRVLNCNVEGTGVVSLDNLPKGCYIYRVAGMTGKIYLK